MDKSQLVDQITAIDLQISRLREQMRPIRGEAIEGDRMQHDRLQQEVRHLVERKAELRVALAKS